LSFHWAGYTHSTGRRNIPSINLEDVFVEGKTVLANFSPGLDVTWAG
jgi:hypothetical protein